MEEEPALVVGGGFFGSTLAKMLATQGAMVTVCSRHPRNHAGLWRRLEEHLPVRPGMRVWVAIGPSPEEKGEKVWGEVLPRLLQKLEGTQVLVCGPSGSGDGGIDAFSRSVEGVPSLRLPLLFGTEDPWLWPAAQRFREGAVVHLEKNLPPCWPLFVEDAARAAVGGVTGTLRGPERWEPSKMLDALIERYGQGSWKRGFRLWSSPAALRAKAQVETEDHWPERMGMRLPLATWIERLPGPRRRR